MSLRPDTGRCDLLLHADISVKLGEYICVVANILRLHDFCHVYVY